LKDAIEQDLRRFFAARPTFERYRVSWRRGLLLAGPPGNGKTFAIKALVHRLAKPCLYVKSLKARYSTSHDCIRTVFGRARQTTPCLLVLEDLDTLIDDKNRSYFLNELDGFAANIGVVVVATTNYPERLDPALAARPSRFDRTYAFPLPAAAERHGFLSRWNA